jgi:hypothetical protein
VRIGKWVQIYKNTFPIPRRLSMAFGLYDTSQLHLARLPDEDTRRKFGIEVLVSPVPFSAWRSACRLSVRLNDKHGALATATEFLKKKRINIMLCECCSTYQLRAHWDAICDISQADGYQDIDTTDRVRYEAEMAKYLDSLAAQFGEFAADPRNSPAFLLGPERLIQFQPLYGLNDASFHCNQSVMAVYSGGSVTLPDKLAHEISTLCYIDGKTLPAYAMLTGNTEQRYMRLLFMKDYDQMFQVGIRDTLRDFAAGGVGVLNQVLRCLPPAINLVRASNYITQKRDTEEIGRIELLGRWDLPDLVDRDMKRAFMETELKRLITTLPVEDADGKKHPNVLEVVDFSTPRTFFPRVFVSYSTRHAADKLKYLENALLANEFQPIRGTDYGVAQQPQANNLGVSSDVVLNAFPAIDGCVAFISLQVPRDDFRVEAEEATRFVLAPWAIAEEVYAWTRGVGLIVRLKDTRVEDPRYNKHILTFTFREDDEFPAAVNDVMEELLAFRDSPQFADFKRAAEEKLLRAHGPSSGQ